MTPLQKAENAVTDTHLRLNALAERRASLEAQIAEAEGSERRLLKTGTDLKALAGIRAQITAGHDLIRQTAAEAEALERDLESARAEVDREVALEELVGHAAAGEAAEAEITALIDQLARLLIDGGSCAAGLFARLEVAHARLRAAREGYEQAGRALDPYWHITGYQRPAERDRAEALLRRRGHSLRAVSDPSGLTAPKGVTGALDAAWGVYRAVTLASWIAAGIAGEQRRREAEAERRRRIGLDA